MSTQSAAGLRTAFPYGTENAYEPHFERTTDEDQLSRMLIQVRQIATQALDHFGERL